ncbi:MAG TPA: hypothetical protein VIH35_00965, partial [Kiritimatiellia bacterium]
TFLIGFIFLSAVEAAVSESTGFNRYQVILDRSPFGILPLESPVAQAVPQGPPFSESFRLSAMVSIEESGRPVGVRVGLIDLRNNESFFLAMGEKHNDVELVSAVPGGSSVTLRWGDQIVVLNEGELNAVPKIVEPHRPAVAGTPVPGADAAQAARRAYYAQRPGTQTLNEGESPKGP